MYSDFKEGYMEALFFTDTDRDGDKGTGITEDMDFLSFSPSAMESIEEDCSDFYSYYKSWWESENMSDHEAGILFWLTRNRHGAGFWDGKLSLEAGKYLTDMSHPYGEVNPYVGDDGKIYL